jgi:Arc/MetJ-type ribon-helix-helix transcriptional regulator
MSRTELVRDQVRRAREERAWITANRPVDINKAYLKEALGRRKSRSRAKAIRAAGLYLISREVVQSRDRQVSVRWQDADAHDWAKAHATPGIPPYGAMQESPPEDVGDAMEAMR